MPVPLVIPTYDQAMVDDEKTSRAWYFFLQSIEQRLQPGLSATITTTKLTGGGANGSMTFVNGILTKQTQAT